MLLRALAVAVLLSMVFSLSCSPGGGTREEVPGAHDDTKSLDVFRDCLRKCGFKKELVDAKSPHLELQKRLFDLDFESAGFPDFASTLHGGVDRLDKEYRTVNLTANWGQSSDAKDYWAYCRTYLRVDKFTPERFRQAKRSPSVSVIYHSGGKGSTQREIVASTNLYDPKVDEILSVEFHYKTMRTGGLPSEEQMGTLLRQMLDRLDQCLVP
jgi:hypothetical protein